MEKSCITIGEKMFNYPSKLNRCLGIKLTSNTSEIENLRRNSAGCCPYTVVLSHKREDKSNLLTNQRKNHSVFFCFNHLPHGFQMVDEPIRIWNKEDRPNFQLYRS